MPLIALPSEATQATEREAIALPAASLTVPTTEGKPQSASSLRARIAARLQHLRAEPTEARLQIPPRACASLPPARHVECADLNRIHLTGTLGSEPLLYDIGDHPAATLTLVSERRWRTASGAMELETTWFTLSASEALAEQCGRLLHHGDRVYVEGSLCAWASLRAGQQDEGCVVIVERFVLLAMGRPPTARTEGSPS